jgi:murein DD-endopeptidase MepM/ murein hydrolase activator NlpD
MKKQKLMVSTASLLFLSCFTLVSFTQGIEVPSVPPVDLAKAKIGDGYGYRIHPATKENKMHTGIDFILAEGDSVSAPANGVVVDVVEDKLRGIYVTIKHNEIYTTSYSHLKSAVVKAGDTIKKKQLLGYVGSTGQLSAQPHLHYEVLKDGKNVDPLDYLPKSVRTKLSPGKP